MEEPVLTKAMMYRLLFAGRFGNYPRSWNSVDEVEKSGFTGLVSIRSLERSNPIRLYHVPALTLREVVAGIADHRRSNGLTFLEAPPDSQRTLQGEWDGTNLFYSRRKEPMRFALDMDGRHANGICARAVLSHYLDPVDVDWLDQLTLDYPEHVIEFSGSRIRHGTLNRRMVVWEVRLY